MIIIKQFGALFVICWLSTIIESILPITFPASVIGLVLLLICFILRILKPAQLQEVGDFFLSNMVFFFIPSAIGLIQYLDVLSRYWLPLLIICVVSTAVTFAVTAWSTMLMLRFAGRNKT